MGRFLKYGKIFLTTLILCSIVLVAINWEKANRLYSVITLFDKEVIVDNFSHMNKAFINKTIRKEGQAYQFAVDKQPLPTSFTYRDKSTAVDEFLERRATTALFVIKDDKISFENYYLGTKPSDQRISWSMAKSFVSVLFGMQVDAGRIDIENNVAFYLPEMKGSGYENVKVKHVLQMSSGVKWNEDYQDFNSDINKMGRVLAIGGSLDEMTTGLAAEKPAGQQFHYVSMDTHVIGMIVRRVSGKSLVALLQEEIWHKIGMESDANWITDSQGVAFALGGLNVTTRDYARFGRLLVNKGRWEEEQLISEHWLNEATTATSDYLKSDEGKLGYGYQIWLPPQAQQGEFFCVGVYGQYIYVNQQENVVIVKNSADKQFQDSLNSKQETMAFFRQIVASLKS
ncbi:serine hydrolase domain-containing protein [Thalassotalea atypica]|uniref:serine hydrolase domain-containing protein n=1 Tax=Thalassotalea atypica TaxID=2054316 RepID=UPI0025742D55|nr:serine hydrolase [Thalassotalea atypica]